MSKNYVGGITIPDALDDDQIIEILDTMFSSLSNFISEKEKLPKKFKIKDESGIEISFEHNE